MKKLIITFAFLFISINAFANMNDCVNASKNENWQKAIEYCKPLANDNKNALVLLVEAYSEIDDRKSSQLYSQEYVNKFADIESNKKVLANMYTGLGNTYYFKGNGAKHDIKKGLKYITKGAQLGNSIAQEQLGNFYNSNDGELPKLNTTTSYKWFEIASINGSQKAKNNVFLRNINVLKEQVPYCIAMGQQLVAESYINGEAGLPKSDNQAKNYLIQAIELYKEAKQPSEDELKYCPPQKGLDLASAEKLLEKIS